MIILALLACLAQQQQQPPHTQHDHGAMQMQMMGNGASQWLMRQSSGTVFQPRSWPMPMAMQHAAGWHLMWMGQAFVVNTQQSGPRGRDATYSANWGMLAAARDVGRGSLMIRGMLSLDPLTVRNRQYPLLFQTGETAYGRPITDGQHPHELLMELSIQYARPIAEKTYWNIYYAPVGEPALGPASFPHRASAMEMPQAVLGHHWQDSTHIANNVATAGITWRDKVRLEGSGFRGREPNENRGISTWEPWIPTRAALRFSLRRTGPRRCRWGDCTIRRHSTRAMSCVRQRRCTTSAPCREATGGRRRWFGDATTRPWNGKPRTPY